jgi:protein gp37
MKDSKIKWTHHTQNFWVGCTKVAVECKFCFASAANTWRKEGANWGPGKPRSRTKTWDFPIKTNAAAAEAGRRERIFCGSYCDFFDHEVDGHGWREEAWDVIRETKNLDWLILTKRPELIVDRLPKDWGDGYPNVWLGTSVGCNESMFRLETLLTIPASIHFLSAEPLLEYIDVKPVVAAASYPLDWMIVGGESGTSARPCNVDWIIQCAHDCREIDAAPFIKQLGRRPIFYEQPLKLVDCMGGDADEWPITVEGFREFPQCSEYASAAGAQIISPESATTAA